MTPERWAQVKELYHAVVEQDPDERRTALHAVRVSDPELCDEVESLLRESDDTWTVRRNPFENLDQIDRRGGQLLGERYRLVKPIGRGGFGVVYLANDERLHRKPVVVKLLTEAARHDAWAGRKFADEVKALARIDHPGVVVVLDTGHTADGVPFLVMQHVEGVTLRSLIAPVGMPLDRAAQIVRQIGQALAAAHGCGILHRDLKPENIMVQAASSGDFVRLIDFGIATIRDDGRSEPTRAVGTAAYMAPEQFRGTPSAASDVFAMAVIAWEMLTGELPSGVLQDPQRGLPVEAVAALRRALAIDPADRFQDAARFGDTLAQALTGGGGGTVELHVARVQQRALDVAAARQIPIHKPAEVVALIRREESGGLTAILEVDCDFSVSKEDVRSKPFRLEFPLDEAGFPADLELGLRLECPDFDPKHAFKSILVAPDGDSPPCTFLITPQYLGELRINLEVVRGQVLIASRVLKTESLASDRVPDASKTLVSISFPVVVREAPEIIDAFARDDIEAGPPPLEATMSAPSQPFAEMPGSSGGAMMPKVMRAARPVPQPSPPRPAPTSPLPPPPGRSPKWLPIAIGLLGVGGLLAWFLLRR